MRPPAIRLLLVDDNPDDRALALRALRGEFPGAEAAEIRDAESLHSTLSRFRFDLAIVDYHLLWSNGLELLPRLRETAPGIPAIMFTGSGNEEVAVAALKAGFDDYVPKSPRHSARLAPSARMALDRARERRRDESLLHLKSLEAISRLAGGVAHDFNNMLTAINGYSEILLSSMDRDHPLRESLEQINLAGSRAARLTRELLAFARGQVLQAKAFDLNPFLARLAPEIRRALGARIHLDLDLSSRPLQVFSDAGQMETVILNMVRNACEAMPEGGELLIRTGARMAGGGQQERDARLSELAARQAYAVIALADTGVGMGSEVLARIFEPFFSTKPRVKRSGMGLSAAYGIVKQSGGTITVESEPGGGTRFEIWIPLSAAGNGQAPAESGRNQPVLS